MKLKSNMTRSFQSHANQEVGMPVAMSYIIQVLGYTEAELKFPYGNVAFLHQ